ncbi:unnamed protein product [Dibothriocephalus latus]|uniref:Uncharacterized protein n=1 Tax=Dibothriocephalus latus TaxID=60516 RepID=A0A3P7LL37_DIBLA|nr:unnamed protein product [Dibothriocephalus latus]
MNKQVNPWEVLYCTFEISEAAVACGRQHDNLELAQQESSTTDISGCKQSRANSAGSVSISRHNLGSVSLNLNPGSKHTLEESPDSKCLSIGSVSQDALDISKKPTHKFQTLKAKKCKDVNPDLEAMLHECFSSLSKDLGMETTHLSSHETTETNDRQNACTTPEVVHQSTSNCSNSFYTNLCADNALTATNECNPKDRGFFDFYDFFPDNPEFLNKCDLDFVDGMSELKTNLKPAQNYNNFDIGATKQHDFPSSADEVRLSPCETHGQDTMKSSCYAKSTMEYEPALRDPEPYSSHGKSEASDGQSHMLETPSPDFFTLLSASSSSTYSVDSNVFSGTEASSSEIKFDSSCAFQNSKSFSIEDARSPLSNMPVLVRFSNNNGSRLSGENDVEVEQAVASIVEDALEMDETDGGSVAPADPRHNTTATTAATSVISSTPSENINNKCPENPRNVSSMMCFTPPSDELTSDDLLKHPKASSVPSFPIMDYTFPTTCSSDGTLPLLSPVTSTSGIDSATSSSFLNSSPLKLADPVVSLAIWNSNLSDLNTAGSQQPVAGGDATDLDSDIWESLELQNYVCGDTDSSDDISGLKSSDLLTGLDPFLSADSEAAMPQCDFQTSMMSLTEGQGEDNKNGEGLMQSTPVAWDVPVTLPSAEPVKAIAPSDSKMVKAETNSGKSRRSNEGLNGSLPLHL